MRIQNSILLAISLMSASAFAAGAPLAEVVNVNGTVSKITLSSEGLLTVTPRATTSETSFQISDANFATAQQLAALVAQAQVVTDHRADVCMIAVLGGNRQLSVSSDGADLRLVLTANGCWTSNYTHPAEADALDDANQLETMLMTLANEASPAPQL